MNKYEQFVQQEIRSVLRSDESIESLGFIYNSTGNGHFFAVSTKYQLVLIETEWQGAALKTVNKNLIQIPYNQIEEIKFGGFLNQKTIWLRLKTGETKDFHLNVLANFVPGQKQFMKKLQTLYQLSREQAQ